MRTSAGVLENICSHRRGERQGPAVSCDSPGATGMRGFAADVFGLRGEIVARRPRGASLAAGRSEAANQHHHGHDGERQKHEPGDAHDR